MITSHTPVSRVKLTLRDAVDRALGLHPEIRAALAVMEGASSEVEAAKGGYYPSLQIASGPENRFRGGWGYDVTVSQVLYDWGGTDSLVASAQAAQRKLTESTQEKRSDVSLDVIELSVDLLTAGQQMEVTSRYHGHL
ncbi:MAG: TolC family protein, partial [Hydrogenophaga sp.]|nr:TolC family protein [Hydrogenophaga sp.]